MPLIVSIKENIRLVRERIYRAAETAGRDPAAIRLVAVTKTVPVGSIEQAIAAGITDLGESRVQEAAPKIELLRQKYPGLTWHLVGHLQRNKVRQALSLFDMIQSLDSDRLAAELQARADQPVPVLIEINTSGEPSKYGIPAEQAKDFLTKLAAFDMIKVRGLMTVGPLAGGPAAARAGFRRLRELKEELDLEILSMGMTDDLEIAIAEGASLVRVGRALFGPRPPKL